MTEVEQILKRVERLSPKERLSLISHLQAANLPTATATRRRVWREIAGTATDLMQNADAQDLISENRQIADQDRSGEALR